MGWDEGDIGLIWMESSLRHSVLADIFWIWKPKALNPFTQLSFLMQYPHVTQWWRHFPCQASNLSTYKMISKLHIADLLVQNFKSWYHARLKFLLTSEFGCSSSEYGCEPGAAWQRVIAERRSWHREPKNTLTENLLPQHTLSSTQSFTRHTLSSSPQCYNRHHNLTEEQPHRAHLMMNEDNQHHADLGPPSENSSQDLPANAETEADPSTELELIMTKSQAWNLYTSHFLSTWNMRLYEFAAVG